MKKFFLTPKDVENNAEEISNTLSKGMMDNIKGGVHSGQPHCRFNPNPYDAPKPWPYQQLYGQAYNECTCDRQGPDPYAY